jgi:hypothetical protein
MLNAISETTRDNLFHSFAAVEAAAPAIKAAMVTGLASAEGEAPPFERSRSIASALVDMLIGQARRMAEGRGPSDVAAIVAEHRALGIEGRHYSRFGDALVPVLRDAVGPRLPGAVTSAWGDAFWSVIRRVMRQASLPRPPAAGDEAVRRPAAAAHA